MEDNKFYDLWVDNTYYTTTLSRKFLMRKKYERPDERQIKAIMPATILKVKAREGRRIKKGDFLFSYEAMKMQNEVYAHMDGKIAKIHIKDGQIVPKGDLLLEFE